MKMKQKVFAVILVLFAAGFIGCDGNGGGGSSNIEPFTESFQADYQSASIRSLEVSTINGKINISGHNGDEILVSGLKRANTAEGLEKVDLQVTQENNQIIFKVVHETTRTDLAIDLDLIVPADIIVEEVESVNGPVEVTGMPLIDEIDTTNGSIRVDISGTDEDIDLGSVNGRIDVYISTDLNATIDMITVNGTIDLNGVPLNLTLNQPKHRTGDLGAGGDEISISTVNGAIELHRL